MFPKFTARKSTGAPIRRLEVVNSDSERAIVAPRKQFAIGWNNKDYSDVVLYLTEDKAAESPPKRKKTAESEKAIYVSRMLLASESPYFQKLFANGMKESHQNQIHISLEADEHKYFIDLLRFLYTGIFEEDLVRVAILADKFDISSALTECAQLLESQLKTVAECDQFLTMEDQFSHVECLTSLLSDCGQFLIEHYRRLHYLFSGRLNKTEFENLHVQSIEVILQSDSLEVTSENVVYRALELWLAKDHSRNEFIPRLLPHIRFTYLSSPNFLHDIIRTHPVIGNSSIYQEKAFTESLYFGFSNEQKRKWQARYPVYRVRSTITKNWIFHEEVGLHHTWDYPAKTECFIDGYRMSVQFFTVRDHFHIVIFLMDFVQYLKLKTTVSVTRPTQMHCTKKPHIADWADLRGDEEITTVPIPPDVASNQTVTVNLLFEFL